MTDEEAKRDEKDRTNVSAEDELRKTELITEASPQRRPRQWVLANINEAIMAYEAEQNENGGQSAEYHGIPSSSHPAPRETWQASPVKETEQSHNGRKAAVEEGYITKEELAQRLKKTVRTVENWQRRGYLPYRKIAQTVLFRWSEVVAHLDQNFRNGPGRN